uniref:EGF-like calcium-binding domain-containing protein n=1 Tax=Monopterus albus TaxID=43700 RepID=A0A3Q3IYJ3_MONAL
SAPCPWTVTHYVNECDEINGGCEALCCNTIGSFYCRCPPGQTLNDDGKTCQGEISGLCGFKFKGALCELYTRRHTL